MKGAGGRIREEEGEKERKRVLKGAGCDKKRARGKRMSKGDRKRATVREN